MLLLRSALALVALALVATVAHCAPTRRDIPGLPMPKAFSADVKFKTSLLPLVLEGPLYYDFEAQRQRIETTMFGFTQYEVDQYDNSLKYVWAEMFGVPTCNTCFLKPPLYPYYVPPGSVDNGKATVDGVDCELWTFGDRSLGINASFWITKQDSQYVMVKTVFDVGYDGFSVDIEMDFKNVKPGPQDAGLFEPPKDVCPKPKCQGKVSVGLLFDGSASIKADDFIKARSFGVDIVEAFKVSPNAAEIAVTQFSSTVRTEIALSGDEKAVNTAISGMKQLGSGTNTAAGITSSAAELAKRASDHQVMLIITDGQHNEGGSPITAADNAKAKGIEVFSIGVGSGIDKAELNGMASEPKGMHVFEVDDYSALSNITAALVSSSCPGVEECNLNNFNTKMAAQAKMYRNTINHDE